MNRENRGREEERERRKKILEEAFEKISSNIDHLDKDKSNYIGSGSFGIVYEIYYRGKSYAGKLIEIEKNKKNELSILKEFKGPNIIKVIANFHEKINKKNYNLIIMELARLKDLKYLGKHMNNENSNLFELIFKNPFEDKISENFTRYFCKNIINALETLDRGDLIHSDIKPENILITDKFIFKLSDFGLLSRLSDMEKKNNEKYVHLSGGTHGYLIPEYFESLMTQQVSKTQDYFSLGATIYYLKYGKIMLNYEVDKNDYKKVSDNIIDLLQDVIDKIKTTKKFDKYFISFICSLIQYKGEDRPTFEKIYRNKWLNKYSEEINEIIGNNENLGIPNKLIKELFKSDFIIKKQKYLDKLINNNRSEGDYRNHKFIFKNNKKTKL